MSDRRTVVRAAVCLVLVAAWGGGLARGDSVETVTAVPDEESGAFGWTKVDLEEALRLAPAEDGSTTKPVLEVPSPFGGLIRFEIVRSPLMDPDLAKDFPGLESFRGQGTGAGHRADTLRLVNTPWGCFAQVLSPSGDFLVRPARLQAEEGVVFQEAYPANDPSEPPDAEEVESPPAEEAAEPGDVEEPSDEDGPGEYGTGLRVYRMAVATSAEWSAKAAKFLPGGNQSESYRAITAVLILVSRVTGIFERDLGIRFRIVPGTAGLLSTDLRINDREMTVDEAYAKIEEDLATKTTFLGGPENDSFEVGHVFLTTGGGKARIGSVGTSKKGLGVTGWSLPWDTLAVNLFAHELGHQFGADHTFNVFSEGARNPATAMEPGSGSTIMGYAGRCGEANVQAWSDAYFHAANLQQIREFLLQHSDSLPEPATSVNQAPSVEGAGRVLLVPPRTPFTLRPLSARDDDGDEITFSVEQMDAGTHPAGLDDSGDGTTPLFRSLPPTLRRERSFPRVCQLYESADFVSPPSGPPADATPGSDSDGDTGEDEPDVSDDLPNRGEVLPSAAADGREFRFRITLRDNRSGGGATAFTDVTVKVKGTEPFIVHDLKPPWGSDRIFAGQHELKWDPTPLANAMSDVTSDPMVRIRVSLDGGRSWRTLVDRTANTGSAKIVLPCEPVCGARIRVESVDDPCLTIFAVTRAFAIAPYRAEFPVAQACQAAPGIPELTPIGQEQVVALVEELRPRRPRTVYYTEGTAARLTAVAVATRLRARALPLPDGFSPGGLSPTVARGIAVVVGEAPEEWASLGLPPGTEGPPEGTSGVFNVKVAAGGVSLSRRPLPTLPPGRRRLAEVEVRLDGLERLVRPGSVPPDPARLREELQGLIELVSGLAEDMQGRKGFGAGRASAVVRRIQGEAEAIAEDLGERPPTFADVFRIRRRLAKVRTWLRELRRTMGW